MSLKLLYSLLPAGLFLLAGYPTIAQSPDGIGAPSIEEGIPNGSQELESAPVESDTVPVEPAPVEPPPVEPEPSADPEISPDSPAVSEPNTAPVGGVEGPDGPHTLVQCGPGGAASVVTEVPAGCRILGVNSPPGQRMNAESP